MSAFLERAILAASVTFFFLGFIFCIVGYETFWLIPREQYADGSSQIDGVGLHVTCFTSFRFPNIINLDKLFDGCKDNLRNSAFFNDLSEDVWSPRWFQALQDVHLASIIMSVFNLLLIGAFIAIYAFAEWRSSKRKKPLLSLTLTKTGLSLWFIITIILGCMQLAEPLVFYTNYQNSKSLFYYSEKPYDYGPGFGITIGAGLCYLVSAGLACYIFCIFIRKLIKPAFRAEQQAHSRAQSEESIHDADDHKSYSTRSSRKAPDGIDDDEIEIQEYKTDPSRSSTGGPSDLDRSESKPEMRPVPRPRRSTSREFSREPSVSRQEVAGEYASAAPVTPSAAAPAPRSRRSESPESVRPYSTQSVASSMRSPPPVNPQQFKYDYQPGYGYVPKSARPVEAGHGGQRSAQLSPYSPGAQPYYNPSGQARSYAGSVASDGESYRSDRNRSTVGGQHRQPSPDTRDSSQKVITPKSAKSSRYAAAGW